VLIDAQTPIITNQPQSATYDHYETPDNPLSVTASVSNGTLYYQWYKTSENGDTNETIAGETGSTFSPPTNVVGEFYYYVVVTNKNYGVSGNKEANATSNVAKITINNLTNAQTPIITNQPQSATYDHYETPVTPLSVTVEPLNDDGALYYQWFYSDAETNTSGTPITSSTIDPTFSPPTNETGYFYYYVVVTNKNFSVSGNKEANATSSVATITIDELIHAQDPNITAHPQSVTYTQGQTATLSVTATSPDSGTLSYQWYSNTSNSNSGGTQIPNATDASYTTPNDLSVDNHYYYVIVTNTKDVSGNKEANATSEVAKITIDELTHAATPVIDDQPQSASYNHNATSVTPLSITIEALTDGGTLSYQWYKTSENGDTNETIVGETDPTFSPPTNEVGDFYYYVVVTNTNNSVNGNQEANATSNVAKITIECLVSFYDANLDFNASISVQANSTINIASLKTELGLDATALYLASDRIVNDPSYQVTQSVNFYAVANVQEIRTEAELNNTRNDLSGKYILLNNIELTSDTLGADDGAGWNPIGDSSNAFKGIFNGNEYAIRNLWIDRPSINYVGLFGYIYGGAKIRNLSVDIDSSKGGVIGQTYVDGIAGRVGSSSITDSYSTGNVSGTSNVGGISGNAAYSSSITNSYSTGDVSGTGNYVGGIAGYVYNSTIIDNAAINKEVNGSSYVNRIVGSIGGGSVQNNFALDTMKANW
jgi:hypothetical protein